MGHIVALFTYLNTTSVSYYSRHSCQHWWHRWIWTWILWISTFRQTLKLDFLHHLP